MEQINILEEDYKEFQLLKSLKPKEDKAIVLIGNSEESLLYNRSILLRKITKNNTSVVSILENSLKILDNLSLVWDEFTDSTLRNSVHKLYISSEGYRLDSKLIGYTEVDKNLLFQSLNDEDQQEKLFSLLNLEKAYVKISEIFNSILIMNKFEFIEGGINDRFKVKNCPAVTRF